MFENTLNAYSDFNKSLDVLKTIDTTIAETPIKENKWSIKEIIAHIYRWDLFLIERGIQNVMSDRAIVFPSDDDYNLESEQFAKTISYSELIDLTSLKRNELIEKLKGMNELLLEPITINGYTHCSKTNSRYTMLYLMSGFVEHDRHHLTEIDEYLLAKNLELKD